MGRRKFGGNDQCDLPENGGRKGKVKLLQAVCCRAENKNGFEETDEVVVICS